MSLRIAIVGGGVVGCSLAYHLAERGLGRVTLFERESLSGGTTWHSAGNITWKPHSDDDAPVLYAYELIELLERNGLQSTGWHRMGRLFLALTRRGARRFRSPFTRPRANGTSTDAMAHGAGGRRCSPSPAGRERARWRLVQPALGPRESKRLHGVAWHGPPRSDGAEIVEKARVERLQVKAAGAIAGLTCDGAFHDFDRVIVAAGLWSRALTAPLGYPAAQWGCEHFYLIARPERAA